MSKTTQNLVDATLQDLGALGAGLSAIGTDYDTVVARITPLLSDLAVRRIVTIGDANAIPDHLFPALVRRLVETCAPMFGPATNEKAVQAAEADLAALSRLDLNASTGLTLAVLDQLARWGGGSTTPDAAAVVREAPRIIAALSVRGAMPSFDAATVPDEYLPDLTLYIAARLAPAPRFDVMREAERSLRVLSARAPAAEPVQAEYF